MFWKKNPKPADALNSWQIVERFKGHVRDEIDAALDGRQSDYALQRDIARALRDEAQLIESRRATMQPL